MSAVMKDIFGQDLMHGDKVALTPHNYKSLVIGTIVGFTAQQVRVSYARRDWRGNTEETTILRSSCALVKAPEQFNF
jgi:hypothetical protein